MPIYMNYNDIQGDVTADGHTGWVELSSFQWGVSRGISSPTGASADRESSAPSVSEILVGKDTDVSSTKLLNEALQGEGQNVQIDFCKTDKGSLEVYLSLNLEDCMISNYTCSGKGGSDNTNAPAETLRLNFTKVEFKYIGMSDTNAGGSPDTVAYDVALAKVV